MKKCISFFSKLSAQDPFNLDADADPDPDPGSALEKNVSVSYPGHEHFEKIY